MLCGFWMGIEDTCSIPTNTAKHRQDVVTAADNVADTGDDVGDVDLILLLLL